MAIVTLAPLGKKFGDQVISGTIWLPRVGAWVAEIAVSADTAPTGKVELQVGTRRLVGTVARADVVEGLVQAQLVAGGNGLRSEVAPIHYTAPTMQIVLARIALDVGESLSAASDAGVLDQQLEHWTTMRGPAALAIRALVELAPAGTVWRIRPDGQLWVGAETWPDSGIGEVAVTAEHPELAALDVDLDEPYLLPGTLLGGRRVDLVKLTFDGAGAAARVWTLPG